MHSQVFMLGLTTGKCCSVDGLYFLFMFTFSHDGKLKWILLGTGVRGGVLLLVWALV